MFPTDSRKRAISRDYSGRFNTTTASPPSVTTTIVIPGQPTKPTISTSSRAPLRRTISGSSGTSLGSIDFSLGGGSTVTTGSYLPSPLYKTNSKYNHQNNNSNQCCPDVKTIRWLQRWLQLGRCLQRIALLGILLFLMYIHIRSNHLQERVLKYRLEEQTLMLQLHQMELRSASLYKDVQRRVRIAADVEGGPPFLADEEPIHLETISERLYQSVLETQRAIQDEAGSLLSKRYGHGSLKLVLDLQFDDDDDEGEEGISTGTTTGALEIQFFPTTPHATWTLLDQVNRRLWDDAIFEWGSKKDMIEITPIHEDPQRRGQLEFTEDIGGRRPHSQWTVGIRDDPDTGRLQLFLNLQDNVESYEHETCVGHVVNGFDTLQRLIRAIRKQQLVASNGKQSVILHRARAMHATTR